VITDVRSYALARDEGQPLWFLGSLTLVKATGGQTHGAFGLVEQLLPPGFSSPWHLHHREDEAFYVVEGEMTFICGNDRVKAGPGAYVYGPRGVPHGFRVEGSSPARLLLLNAPAGFEQFVVEMSEPASGFVLPVASPPDMGKLIALAAKYQIDILGPLPD
jgi:mannose-6-phosphate isomerase-like protein (cupin superfamily)